MCLGGLLQGTLGKRKGIGKKVLFKRREKAENSRKGDHRKYKNEKRGVMVFSQGVAFAASELVLGRMFRGKSGTKSSTLRRGGSGGGMITN